MTKEDRQEALSRAYVLAVAGACGLTHTVRSKDYGIDLSLHEVQAEGVRYAETGTQVDVQLKSTTRVTRTGDGVGLDLDVRTYDTLRAARPVPRLLLLLVLPADEPSWLRVTADALELRAAAYWLSLRGRPAVPNRRSVRVTIPHEHRFTPDALRAIMQAARVRRGSR